jgi:hypothetical protein
MPTNLTRRDFAKLAGGAAIGTATTPSAGTAQVPVA